MLGLIARLPPHALFLALALTLVATAGATVSHQLTSARADAEQNMAYNVREIQESLSSLHRDLEIVNMLVASAGGNPDAATITAYLTARRNELSAVRWLGYIPTPAAKPQMLLGSAVVVGFDQRRDPVVSQMLSRIAETGLTAEAPATYHEVASLAVALPVPVATGSPPGQPAIVALIDVNAFLREAIGNAFELGTALEFRLRDVVITRFPSSHPPPGPWRTFDVSMAGEKFTLAFAEASWWQSIGGQLSLPLSLLLAATVLMAFWLLARKRQTRGAVMPLPPPPRTPPQHRAADAAAIHVNRLWQLGELAASLSHDLGQPLNIIRLTAENALDGLDNGRTDPERLRRGLGTAVDQCRRAQAMMDALTSATRRPSESPAPLSPVEVMRAALADIQPRIRDQGILLHWHAEPHCPPLSGHAFRLQAALAQLLTNACEALALVALRGGAGEPGTLAVSCHNDATSVTYVIADNGPGFPADLRASLENPLSATITRGKGCGLGLTMALGIIAEFKGNLSIEDGNPGTRLEIRLPLVSAANGRSLLLVDDESEARATMAEYLRERGWRVRTAGGGTQALAQFRQEAADAVITDLHMEDGDGWTLIGNLHALAPDLPIIVVSTAHADEAKRAVTAGASVVLAKPVGLEDLREELESAIGGELQEYA